MGLRGRRDERSGRPARCSRRSPPRKRAGMRAGVRYLRGQACRWRLRPRGRLGERAVDRLGGPGSDRRWGLAVLRPCWRALAARLPRVGQGRRRPLPLLDRDRPDSRLGDRPGADGRQRQGLSARSGVEGRSLRPAGVDGRRRPIRSHSWSVHSRQAIAKPAAPPAAPAEPASADPVPLAGVRWGGARTGDFPAPRAADRGARRGGRRRLAYSAPSGLTQ